MTHALTVDAGKFARDGYLLIKAAFSPTEVAAYRANLLPGLDGGKNPESHSGDLLTNPVTATFIADGRLIEITRQLLGGEPVYFGDSSAMYYDGDHAVCSLHKDNADRHDPDAPDWRGDYSIIRFGLYLQDHKNQGGGLMLRAGSHKAVARNRKIEVLNEEVFGWLSGRTRYLPTEVGDLVVWNLRTTHGGMGRYLRGPVRRPITERTQHLVPRFLQSIVTGARLALFASFGVEGPHLDRYLRYLKTRSYMVDMWLRAHYMPEQFAAFAAHDAKLLDMRVAIESDIANNVTVGQNPAWRPLPY